MHGPHAGAQPGGRRRCASGRTQSPAVHTSAPVASTCAHLVGSMAVEVSAFFTANVPPKPQHWSAVGQLDQVDAAHGAQQPQRLVADAAASAASGRWGGR